MAHGPGHAAAGRRAPARRRRAADELEASATLGDAIQERLYAGLGRRRATELIVILSFCGAVARFTNATRAQVEPGDPLARLADPSASPSSAAQA